MTRWDSSSLGWDHDGGQVAVGVLRCQFEVYSTTKRPSDLGAVITLPHCVRLKLHTCKMKSRIKRLTLIWTLRARSWDRSSAILLPQGRQLKWLCDLEKVSQTSTLSFVKGPKRSFLGSIGERAESTVAYAKHRLWWIPSINMVPKGDVFGESKDIL